MNRPNWLDWRRHPLMFAVVLATLSVGGIVSMLLAGGWLKAMGLLALAVPTGYASIRYVRARP